MKVNKNNNECNLNIKEISGYLNFFPVLDEGNIANLDDIEEEENDDDGFLGIDNDPTIDLPSNPVIDETDEDKAARELLEKKTEDEKITDKDNKEVTTNLYDREGNQVNAEGKILKTKEELTEEETKAADIKKKELEAKNEKVFYDKEGNQVDTKGEIVKTKEELETENFDSLPAIKQLQILDGYDLKDEKGEILQFEDTIEGFQAYNEAVSTHRATELYNDKVKQEENDTPEIVKKFNAHIKAGFGVSDFFNSPLHDIQNVKLEKSNENQLKEIIKRSFVHRKYDENRAIEMVKRSEAADALFEDAEIALKELQNADKEQTTINQQKIKEEKEKENAASVNYFNDVKEIVTKGKVKDVVIPNADKKAFYEYLSKPVKSVNGQLLSQHDIDMQKEPLEIDLLNAFHRFKGYDLNSVIKDKANSHKARTLTERIVKPTSTNSTIVDSKNITSEIDWDNVK